MTSWIRDEDGDWLNLNFMHKFTVSKHEYEDGSFDYRIYYYDRNYERQCFPTFGFQTYDEAQKHLDSMLQYGWVIKA